MRAVFGLVGILATIGVIVWIMYKVELPHDQAVLNAQRQVAPEVNQMAGNSRDGSMRFSDSLSLELESTGGRSNSLLVTNVLANGPAATYFGLQRGDSIVEIGPLSVRDSINSAAEGRDMVQDAYQRKQQITVVRNGEKMLLPKAGASTPPASPTGGNKSGDPLQGQLDAIKNAGGR
jgi:hypothetical protein